MKIENTKQKNYARTTTEDRVVFIRLADGKRQLYDVRGILAQNGFTFNKRSYGNSFYEKKSLESEVSTWETFAKNNKLRIDIIPEEYTRSDNYRETYFKNNRPVIEAKYRCAYCGKMMEYKDTTIDHIFPINKLSYDPNVRKRAASWGINGANEEANLVTACRSCNSKKGTKMGIWIYRGFYGKSETLWKFRKVVRMMIAILAVLIAFGLYVQSLKPNTFSSEMICIEKSV